MSFFENPYSCYSYASNMRLNALYNAALSFKNRLALIEDTYFSHPNDFIPGNDISCAPQDYIEFYGGGNYVFHDQYNDIPIIGGNVVRIGKYDLNLDKIDLLRSDPFQAIHILSPAEINTCFWC